MVLPTRSLVNPRAPIQVVPYGENGRRCCRRKSGRGCDRFRIADLSADERCSKPVLWFLGTTGVGKSVPKERPTEGNSDASVVDYGRWRKWRPSWACCHGCAQDGVCMCGLCRGEPRGVDGRAEGAGREARCGAGGAEARDHGRISFVRPW